MSFSSGIPQSLLDYSRFHKLRVRFSRDHATSCPFALVEMRRDPSAPYSNIFMPHTLTLWRRALETQANRIPITDLQDILAVAHLAHKYEMTTWETWAFLVIDHLIDRHPSGLSSPEFVAIYHLCRQRFAEDVGAKISAQWLGRITSNELPISDALNAAEASHDRHFLTSLYKVQLSRIPTTTTNMFHPTKLPMDGIAPVHVQRILAGFCSLSLSWKYHNTICIPATTSHWINAVTQAEKISISEMGYRINALKGHLSVQLSPRNTYESERCQYGSDALTSFVKWHNELAGTMEGHFFGMTPHHRPDPYSPLSVADPPLEGAKFHKMSTEHNSVPVGSIIQDAGKPRTGRFYSGTTG
ncbi:hypothetical protein B0H11DRAFT_1928920 [Mycena galericulata]|nr:hypothetical protein B0H11DRAFT_1928920 [Mycena galericulata]